MLSKSSVASFVITGLAIDNRGFQITDTIHPRLNSRDFPHTVLGKRVAPRLRELAPHGQRESGGGIHAI